MIRANIDGVAGHRNARLLLNDLARERHEVSTLRAQVLDMKIVLEGHKTSLDLLWKAAAMQGAVGMLGGAADVYSAKCFMDTSGSDILMWFGIGRMALGAIQVVAAVCARDTLMKVIVAHAETKRLLIMIDGAEADIERTAREMG